MKFIVTGANGFLGINLVEYLLSLNHTVVAIDKNTKNLLNIKVPKLKIIETDLATIEKYSKSFKNVDCIYHFAALADLDACYKNPLETVRQNILPTIKLLEICKLFKIKKFIFSSTIYTSGLEGGFYRCSKKACEDYIQQFSKQNKIDFIILKFGSLYGVGSELNNGLHKIVYNALKNKKIVYFGNKNSQREYIHVIDAVKCSYDIFKKGFKNKIVNITGHQSVKITEVLELMREILSFKSKIKIYPKKYMGHYTISAHSINDNLGIKYLNNPHIDFHEGLTSLIRHVKKSKNIKK